MAKALIDVDDDLLRRAREILGAEATKKDAVNVCHCWCGCTTSCVKLVRIALSP